MQNYLFFIPISWAHVHPVLVHFTTALLPVSLFSDAVGKCLARRSLNDAAFWMLLYAALATPLTALAGWMWADAIGSVGVGKTAQMLATHQLIGIVLTACYMALAGWRGKSFILHKTPGVFYLASAGVTTAFLLYQGYLGGTLTMG